MKRDIHLALRVLQVVQANADLVGMDRMQLESLVAGRSSELANEITYNIDLLIAAGFLREKSAPNPGFSSIQLTWTGHDLIDELMKI